ncbi:MAG: hypothetical protein JWN56_979 [Sphingobacteriales bacterium]|nr:hypothetical protein [Sphingobacteriales bacterium]
MKKLLIISLTLITGVGITNCSKDEQIETVSNKEIITAAYIVDADPTAACTTGDNGRYDTYCICATPNHRDKTTHYVSCVDKKWKETGKVSTGCKEQ